MTQITGFTQIRAAFRRDHASDLAARHVRSDLRASASICVICGLCGLTSGGVPLALERSFPFLDLVRLQQVPLLNVVEAIQADAALHPLADFARVVLLALE